jgi:hypothetical protein
MNKILILLGYKAFTFRYRGKEVSHTVYARNIGKAWKKMRLFIQEQMYGPWALIYDEVAVNRIMEKIYLGDKNE